MPFRVRLPKENEPAVNPIAWRSAKETRPKSRQRGDQARTIPGASPFRAHTSFGVESTEEGRRSCQSVLDLGVECGLGPPKGVPRHARG